MHASVAANAGGFGVLGKVIAALFARPGYSVAAPSRAQAPVANHATRARLIEEAIGGTGVITT